jgi:hypothetical protein
LPGLDELNLIADLFDDAGTVMTENAGPAVFDVWTKGAKVSTSRPDPGQGISTSLVCRACGPPGAVSAAAFIFMVISCFHG